MPENLPLRDLSTLAPQITLGSLDGRYRQTVAPLLNYLSEAALNRARLQVETEWLIFLLEQSVLPLAPQLSAAETSYLRRLVAEFEAEQISELAELEALTRHDVKAVEYLLKKHLQAAPEHLGENTVLPQLTEVVHIFCTSEDINNLAYALTIKGALQNVWLPTAQTLVQQLTEMAKTYAGVPMLARTHGQPATPVTMGKELAVFAHRLQRQLRRLQTAEYLGKLNGATGTYAAHTVALPEVDWQALSQRFVTNLGLTWNPLTTQIESHDWQSELYADLARFNRIAHNLATDMWTYISLGYFRQNLAAQGNTGSSTMPHKVNPIRFENAEANLEISCALLDTLSATLVTSRLQRDLTDSSTQRNIGSALGHSLLALKNLQTGLSGLEVDEARMLNDLNENWEILGEAIQQSMRVAAISGVTGMDNPYERLKTLTRGRRVTGPQMREFIASLGLPEATEKRLLELTPASYLGLSKQLGLSEVE
ncbi:adenylosuccinate lyase [Boudabousia marimammalium]|uniref:Adenylosuccinate lyase n=2 Tax=Boudabousia marimammalium TaxID=156892 RepID=A0A1Q5PT82_9ACTO|nr:adenylosuccinate lyase [Boudabousia marimammalium]